MNGDATMLKFVKLSGFGVGASRFLLIASFFPWVGNVFAQSTEEEVAVIELGAAERSLTEDNSSSGTT